MCGARVWRSGAVLLCMRARADADGARDDDASR
jgi:hypothetical protein